MKIAIVGSRKFPMLSMVRDYVMSLPPHYMVVSGGARGVDSCAEDCAMINGNARKIFEADWKKYGRTAGLIRNSQIVDAADNVVAFWDGKSKGTLDTITKTRMAKKPLTIITVQVERWDEIPNPNQSSS